MKIGIVSDSHNHLTNLQTALAVFRKEQITTLIHCGDLTYPETAAALGEFRVLHTIGNGDAASGEIRRVLNGLNPLNFSGMVYTGEIEGVPIAIAHGHLAGKVDELLTSGLYRFVFYGHTHRHEDQAFGSTRLINPGALGGRKVENRMACILTLETETCVFFNI
jgi:uncharacterized protein